MKLFGFFKKGAGPTSSGEEEEVKRIFRHFTLLLQANHEALELMADLEEKAHGRASLDPSYLERTVSLLAEKVKDLVASLVEMNGEKYEELLPAYTRIFAQIQKVLERRRDPPPAGYTIGLHRVNAEMRELVGGKAAHLGEVMGKLGLPVPEGFAVTTEAYREFLAHNRLSEGILSRVRDFPAEAEEWEGMEAAGKEIRGRILQSPIPGKLEEALRTSAKGMSGRWGRGLAMRSSAAAEDGDFSFAGQYATFLNVPPGEVALKYREIVASQFTVPALFYLKQKGLGGEEMAMGVLCQALVRARASGILFTTHTTPGRGETVLVNGVWGLGRPAVDGTRSPHFFVLDKKSGTVLQKGVPSQDRMLVPLPGQGVQEEDVPPSLSGKPCLEAEHLKTLWQWARALEELFHGPQDMEWALDDEGNLFLLQTRRLEYAGKAEEEKPGDLSSARVLLEGGATACRGAGSGPVFLVRSEEDLKQFPPGSVLVAVHASPRLVTAMDRAAAIVTDIGSPTGHMAILAREFRKPALVDTRKASLALMPGQEVTVDADHARVYDGRIEELLKKSRPDHFLSPSPAPGSVRLRKVVKLIGPLTLTDPRSLDFHPRSCRTFHDLTRFAHEMAMEEMFHLADQGRNVCAVRITTPIPLNLYAFDLGGGFAPDRPPHSLSPEDLLSVPFRALWKGITCPGVRWAGPVGINIQGLFSVMAQSTTRPSEDYGDRSLVLVSRYYLHFNSRLGYHFATVDSYCGPTSDDNYLAFLFKGGAADRARRGRRAQFLGRVLEGLGFEVILKEDLVKARYPKSPSSRIEEKLDYLGRLMGCARLLDMTMSDDQIVDRYVRSFLAGDYSLQGRGE
jgi:pyruvate,water dikinase